MPDVPTEWTPPRTMDDVLASARKHRFGRVVGWDDFTDAIHHLANNAEGLTYYANLDAFCGAITTARSAATADNCGVDSLEKFVLLCDQLIKQLRQDEEFNVAPGTLTLVGAIETLWDLRAENWICSQQ
jgi:hypothetical protein